MGGVKNLKRGIEKVSSDHLRVPFLARFVRFGPVCVSPFGEMVNEGGVGLARKLWLFTDAPRSSNRWTLLTGGMPHGCSTFVGESQTLTPNPKAVTISRLLDVCRQHKMSAP